MLKRTQKTWRPVEEMATIYLMHGNQPEALTPLAISTDEDGDDVIVMASHHVPLIGPNGPHNLKVSCPGMCGHYGCGKTLTISLN